MTKQTWTATVSAVLFVLLAAVIALVPVPYVTWLPGGTHDLLGQVDGKDAISIDGADTYPTSGQLLMTTVAVSPPAATLSLPEVLFSYWLPSREVLPRSAVYRPGADASDLTEEQHQLMTQSQSTAVIAGLRQSGIPVDSWPMVTSVSNSGPSNGVLEAGDLITEVDGTPTTSKQEVQDAIADRHVGDVVVFTVLRDDVLLRPTVTTRATTNSPNRPVVGITLSIGYSYRPSVKFALDPNIGGTSAGLMFALAIHDLLAPEEITAGRMIAGTGTISSDGQVGAVGGVQEKIAGAVRDGATVFVLPRSNCVDVDTATAAIRLVPVDNLAEASRALQRLNDPAQVALVPECA